MQSIKTYRIKAGCDCLALNIHVFCLRLNRCGFSCTRASVLVGLRWACACTPALRAGLCVSCTLAPLYARTACAFVRPCAAVYPCASVTLDACSRALARLSCARVHTHPLCARGLSIGRVTPPYPCRKCIRPAKCAYYSVYIHSQHIYYSL